MEDGTIINQYKIISAIGKGGMGEVFLAQDTKLDRRVAIKFLNEEFSKDADKLNRFIREAKAVSALNHPNILTVYEIGEKDEANFIVTEFIEGETLREQLSPKETNSLNQILKIGVQVAEALSAAHQTGIVHRDIKPENIMIRADGYAKVLDFGLAKLVEKAKPDEISSEGETKALVNTNPGVVMGTVSYMSPEQARGKDIDARTDIWSLGVVLYEMLAGKVPFTGETINHTIVSILEKEPLLLENVPEELQRIVRKTLTKEVEMRYQTARDLLIDLKNLRRSLDIQGELERSVIPNREITTNQVRENETQIYTEKSAEETKAEDAKRTQNVTTSSSLEYAVIQAKSHKFATAVIGIILLGVITAVAYFGFFAKSNAKQIESIAVMPFVNESGNADTEYLSDGMTETLIKSLSQIPNLNVKARSLVFHYKGKEIEPKKLAAELNVQAVLNGRVVERGDQLTLSLELIDGQTDNVIWSESYNRKQADIVTLQSEIARDVSSKMKAKLSGADEQKVTKAATSDPEAYQAYLKGRYYWNRRTAGNLKKAIEQFKTATDRDPNYALAYAGLADCYALLNEYAGVPLNETAPQTRSYGERALTLDAQLGEPHAALANIYMHQWQWAESEKEYKRAIELNPNYPTVYHWYSLLLSDLGRNNEAMAMIKRAHDLDPLSSIINENLAERYQEQNDHETSVKILQNLLELDPNFGFAYFDLGLSYLRLGRNAEAVNVTEKGLQLTNRYYAFLGGMGYVYAKTGKRAEAIAIVKELEEKYARREATGQSIAYVYAGLGDRDKTFEWLEKDFQSRDGKLSEIKTSVVAAEFPEDPRYKDLLKRMNLPE